MMFPTSYACAKRIDEVLQTESSIADGKKSLADRPKRCTVEFKHVTFAYPGADEPVLKDVSFYSGPGEVTAIIGVTYSLDNGTANPVRIIGDLDPDEVG